MRDKCFVGDGQRPIGVPVTHAVEKSGAYSNAKLLHPEMGMGMCNEMGWKLGSKSTVVRCRDRPCHFNLVQRFSPEYSVEDDESLVSGQTEHAKNEVDVRT